MTAGDDPTQRCSAADVAFYGRGPVLFPRTYLTFLYIGYTGTRIHVCTELEDRSPDKSQYLWYSGYVLRFCYVDDIHTKMGIMRNFIHLYI